MEQTENDQRGMGREIMVERRGRDRQRTYMNDSRTWTTVWELTVGKGGGMGEGGQIGNNWDNCTE